MRFRTAFMVACAGLILSACDVGFVGGFASKGVLNWPQGVPDDVAGVKRGVTRAEIEQQLGAEADCRDANGQFVCRYMFKVPQRPPTDLGAGVAAALHPFLVLAEASNVDVGYIYLIYGPQMMLREAAILKPKPEWKAVPSFPPQNADDAYAAAIGSHWLLLEKFADRDVWGRSFWKWGCAAARQNHRGAQFTIGNGYRYGIEPETQSAKLTYVWIRLAFAEGMTPDRVGYTGHYLQYSLNETLKMMSGDDKAQAQRILRDVPVQDIECGRSAARQPLS